MAGCCCSMLLLLRYYSRCSCVGGVRVSCFTSVNPRDTKERLILKKKMKTGGRRPPFSSRKWGRFTETKQCQQATTAYSAEAVGYLSLSLSLSLALSAHQTHARTHESRTLRDREKEVCVSTFFGVVRNHYRGSRSCFGRDSGRYHSPQSLSCYVFFRILK